MSPFILMDTIKLQYVNECDMHGIAHVFIVSDANKFGLESLFEILGDLRVLLKFRFTLDIR
jgi:hypothetical protein